MIGHPYWHAACIWSGMLKEEQSAAGVSELEIQARAAYEQRRTRECVALTKALLSADPENVHGQMLHSAIQRDLHRDLADAAALLEDSVSQGDGQKYKKAAEIILLKVIYLDPDNAQAKALLAKAKTASAASQPNPATTPAEPQQMREEEIPFIFGAPIEKKIQARPRRLTIPVVLVAALVLAGALFAIQQYRPTTQGAVPKSFEPASTPRSTARPGSAYSSTTFTPPGSNIGGSAGTAPVPGATLTQAASTPNTTDNSTAVASLKPSNSFDSDGPIAFVEAGTLAVSSPVTAEIYLGDKHLGSTPITLQLLAGRHTLEYRRGDLRTVVTHNIRANQTTTAVVSFDVTVQINARPWAQVFVEGTARRALGQTPLSNVRVPLGSVLTFENPNFPSKDYRVTDADTAIQVVFP
jgi:hypothetical protein